MFPMISKTVLRAAMAGSLVSLVAVAQPAVAQNAYYAGIAYSQSTGKIGYTTRRARTEQEAQQLAAANCGAQDAKTYIWGPNEWVAIATVDGVVGTAGFGRGESSDEAQRKALDECAKRAKGEACRVAFCIHGQGMKPQTLLSMPRDPKLPPKAPAPTKPEFVAAIAYSPSTGKIGSTVGHARTAEEAQTLAVKNCGAPDAKAYMWGGEWVAIAVATDRKGVAGFGPGATREIAEQAALAQCKKYGNGAPCRIALSIQAAGDQAAKSAPVAASPAAPKDAAPQPTPASGVVPAAAQSPQKPSPAPTNPVK